MFLHVLLLFVTCQSIMVRTVEPRKKDKVHIFSGRSTEKILKRLILRIKYLTPILPV